MGETAAMFCSIDGAGVVVLASDACLHCQQMYCVLGTGRNPLLGNRIRGAIVGVNVLVCCEIDADALLATFAQQFECRTRCGRDAQSTCSVLHKPP